MVKTLKKRFVIAAMSAITLLLIVLLGILNIANALYTSHETDKLLNILSVGEALPIHPAPHGEREQRFFSPPPDENRRMSALYFTAKKTGNDFVPDVSKAPSVTEEDALALISTAEASDKPFGKIGTYKYRRLRAHRANADSYIFLDTSSHRYAVLRVFLLSCTAGVFAWVVMLMIVILLSRRAIVPIAKNIERQKQFVTDAGHEIKTPLAIILANTEALELHNGENKWSRNIKEQISRLNGLMRDLLTLAKSDEGTEPLATEKIDLSELLLICTDMFSEPASLRGISIKRLSEDNLFLVTNRDCITRIITALLDNAVKYAKSQSEIVITLSKSEKATEILLKNECESLPSCEPEKLFDRFYREDSARTQKSGGYGIGLSSARAIAQSLGGNITAKYEDDNSITFTVKL
ncbi:MAG: HAMP domain-containing histidine kinase [Oscillospiraceae bacterium]|nr:HAMP domain-containing histidine kinase [Oscillospiraceae bacterium]